MRLVHFYKYYIILRIHKFLKGGDYYKSTLVVQSKDNIGILLDINKFPVTPIS